MTITIFAKENCKGASKVLSGNIADLKGKDFDKPSSIRLDDAGDAVLLFKNDDWHGGVLYLRGKRTVEDLGKGGDGGEWGFGNSIRSVRITPFQLDLNVTVVKDGKLLPGAWTTEAQAEADIRAVIANANAFYSDQQALLRLEIARIRFRADAEKFEMNRNEGLPNDWTERGEVDTVFVDRFTGDRGTIGRGQFPCRGQTVVVTGTTNATRGADFTNSVDDMTYILLHEIGHYLGLSHNTADDRQTNLMFDTKNGSYSDKNLKPEQIEEMHQKLARNISRRGDRN
jgi:hypothetical protein